MASETIEKSKARFTHRLEAFSDLVFGFSISLLATRLDLPPTADGIFATERWLPMIGTFALICRFWLEHYRIFRHDFIAQKFDVIVNFIFLFAIAVFPYAIQIFFRFEIMRGPFTLYLGDLILVFLTLSILRIRGLQQRRNNTEDTERLSDWTRSLSQIVVAAILLATLVALRDYKDDLKSAASAFGPYVVGTAIAVVILIRKIVRRLPAFLA